MLVVKSNKQKKEAKQTKTTEVNRVKLINASMSQEEQEMVNKMMTETSVELSMIQDKLE